MAILRVAFPYKRPATSYDPTAIYLSPEYIFLENTFSSLVEINAKGEIVSGVASRFEWLGNELHLTIRDDLKTIDGTPITAEDAAFSLKRVLIRSSNTHGNIKTMLCGANTLKNIHDACEGIRVQGKDLILKANMRKIFLLPMLAAIDFAVIPKTSVNAVNLDITDYRNTSGPYFVESDDGRGNIVLKANTGHYRYSPNIPQEIVLVPSDTSIPDGSLKDFEAGKVDFITTIDATKPEDVLNFASHRTDVELFKTMDIRAIIVGFTERGMRELSEKQRLKIGSLVREAYRSFVTDKPAYKNSEQFVPILGEGALLPEQIEQLHERFNSAQNESAPQGLTLSIVRLGSSDQLKATLKRAVPGLTVVDAAKAPSFTNTPINEMPHMVLRGPDTGFLEDIGLISYAFAAGYFGLSKDEQLKWMDKYTSTEDKAERIKMFRQLHFDSLMKPVMVPISVLPYVAIARKPWKIELSTLYANNQLWRVHQN